MRSPEFRAPGLSVTDMSRKKKSSPGHDFLSATNALLDAEREWCVRVVEAHLSNRSALRNELPGILQTLREGPKLR